MKTLMSILAVVTLASSVSTAAVVDISGFTVDPAGNPVVSNSVVVTSISTASGTTSSLGGAASTANVTTSTGGATANDSVRNLWAENDVEVNGGAAIVGLSVGTGLLDVVSADIFFGQSLVGAAGASNDIFVLDFGATDVFGMTPLDVNGNVIGTGFTFRPANQLPGSPTLDIRADDSSNFDGEVNPGDNHIALNGFAFDVEDFADLSGSLAGIRLTSVSGSTPDPVIVAYNLDAVPEPASLALLGLGGLGALLRRRR